MPKAHHSVARPTRNAVHRPGSAASFSGATEGMLARLVYRSRATSELSPPDLQQLTARAQARNATEKITGLVLFDDGHFFQWLEGPPDSLERVMTSIRGDSRHTDIEVLTQQKASARTFGDWNMKLAANGPQAASWTQDVIKPARDIVEDLRLHPEAAPDLLVQLSPMRNPREAIRTKLPADEPAEDTSAMMLADISLHAKTAAILRSVMLSTVIPALAVRHADEGASSGSAYASRHVSELASLLIAADQQAARDFITELRAEGAPLSRLHASLFEPAARAMGDLWAEDDCTEFDVTLGLSRLQSAIRLLAADCMQPRPNHTPRPVVLVAPSPGEAHSLSATLTANVLWQAGWSPHLVQPSTDQALAKLLETQWFDVLDLNTSPAFRREHALPRLSHTIVMARQASCNPALCVILGGRIFHEDSNAYDLAGADGATRTSLHADRVMLKTLRLAGAEAGRSIH